MSTDSRKIAAFFLPLVLLALALCAAATPAFAAPPKEESISSRMPEPDTGVINLNTATEDQLVQLPSVGASKAAAVVAWRKKHGSFKRIEDLMRVKGFGRKTFLKLKPYLSVAGATTFQGKKTPRGDTADAAP